MLQGHIRTPPCLREPALGDYGKILENKATPPTYWYLDQKTPSETCSWSTAKTNRHFPRETWEVSSACSLPCCKKVGLKSTFRQQESWETQGGVNLWDPLDAADSSAGEVPSAHKAREGRGILLWEESTPATAARCHTRAGLPFPG